MNIFYKIVALILITPIVIGVSFFCLTLLLMIGVIGLIYGDQTDSQDNLPVNPRAEPEPD